MDSFYGAPRQPPRPPTVKTIERNPVVPEVSMIDNSFFPHSRSLKQNFDNNSSFLKKHVRFKNRDFNFEKENVPQTAKTPNLNGKTFKQIYMANVPDRHLDLSIFEPSTKDNLALLAKTNEPQLRNKFDHNFLTHKSLSPPKCNKQFSSYANKLKSIENTSLSPQLNERANRNYLLHYEKTPKRAEISIQTDPVPAQQNCTEVAPANDEPTIRDLFKIIQQQNEQIMLLQRQVNNLTTMRQPEIEPIEHQTEKPYRDLGNSPTKKLFSFDVKATSFEFSFRPPQPRFRKNEFLEPKIQEIVECENTDVQNNSLHLDESLDVKNSYVSNVPSIAIEMDEYRSSDEEDEPQIGLTFYKELMNQVNNALKQAQKKSECQAGSNTKDLTGQTMKAVKQATLQHLKNIGVNLSPIQESSEVTKESDSLVSDQSDVSCAVQQLLMKYLPSEKLAKAANKPKPVAVKERKIKHPAEFSFATLQYMKKYNLIDNTKLVNDPEKKPVDVSPKILDVTALKLQPKLL